MRMDSDAMLMAEVMSLCRSIVKVSLPSTTTSAQGWMLLKRAYPTQRDLDRARTLSRELVGQHLRQVSCEGSPTVLRSGRVCTAVEVALLPTASSCYERADFCARVKTGSSRASCRLSSALHNGLVNSKHVSLWLARACACRAPAQSLSEPVTQALSGRGSAKKYETPCRKRCAFTCDDSRASVESVAQSPQQVDLCLGLGMHNTRRRQPRAWRCSDGRQRT